MFLTNIAISNTIVNYLKASCECRKIGSFDNFPLEYFVECSNGKIFLLSISSIYIGTTVIVSNVIIFKNYCFRHDFAHENRQYMTITCILTAIWCFNMSMFWKMSKFFKNDVSMYYFISDCYKNIGNVHKSIFVLGVVVLHSVSLYLFENNFLDRTCV